MPKRKRSAVSSLHSKLEKFQDDLFKALKSAKGFERQRLSKRLHDSDATPAKKERVEKEINVLKSLDLHHTARAHLYSSLLKIKSIAASTDIPDELRRGVSKPDLTENERATLHNVTSGLYNRDAVKQCIDSAIAEVCESIGVPVPQKGKRARKDKTKEDKTGDKEHPIASRETPNPNDDITVAESWDDVTDFEGFESDVDQPGSVIGEAAGQAQGEEESAFSQYDHLLASSSDDDEEEFDLSKYERFRGTEQVNLDDISVSGSDLDSGSIADSESVGSSASRSPSPPPKRKKESKSAKANATASAPTGSTFLPSLMGGYISGSESASDVDVAPAKKRRGQRARQAIWEKKYGAGARHVQNTGKKGGRDSGWDMKRGAVDGEDGAKNTPWKKGVRSPFMRNTDTNRPVRGWAGEGAPPPRPTRRDDEGTLHPSWEARKKAKEQKTASFSGQKITFD